MDRIPSNIRTYVAVLLLSVLVLSAYGGVGSYGFVMVDDRDYVAENTHVKQGLTWEGAAWAFSTFTSGHWHPLTWLSHMADVSAFGLDAGRLHQVNVLLHLLNTVLLFLVLKAITGSLPSSAFAAALFAAHPLHVESVAWVSERKDVLSTLFWILGMGAYARYVRRPGTWRYLGVAACLALGLLSKPTLVTFPFVLLLLDWWPLGRFGEGPLSPKTAWPLVREKIPLFALSAASSVVTYVAQSTAGAMGSPPLVLQLSNTIVSYGWYLLKTVWPTGLAAFYPHPYSIGESPAAWAVACSALLLAGITCLALRFGRRWPFLPAGWLWYLGTLVPVIGLVQVGAQGMADRYTYVPLTGVFIIVSWGIPAALSGWQWRFREPALWILGATALAALALSARAQAGYWRDSATLFTRALAVTERNWWACEGMGQVRREEGRHAEALDFFRKSLELGPDRPKTWNNLGIEYDRLGRTDDTIRCLTEAVRLDPTLPEGWNNLGNIYNKIGRFPEAADAYRNAVQLNPGNATAWNNLGTVYIRLGRKEEALPPLREAVRLAPGDPEAWNNLGNAYNLLGRFSEAVDSYGEAIRLAPGNPMPRANLGMTYIQSGRKDKAAEIYRQLLRIDPKWARQLAERVDVK